MATNPDDLAPRSPRVRIQVNGISVDSVLHADFTASGSCKSSKFEVIVSLIGGSQTTQWLNEITGRVALEIFLRIRTSDDEISMFEGFVDNISLDPIQKIARLRGRDYSALLASSTYQESYQNQTSSEIAATIAARHGFNSNIVATTALVGSYQSDGFSQILLNAHSRITSEWDLLIHLAKIEDFELFVIGKTLVFAPITSLQSNNLVLTPGMATKISFQKTCPLYEQTTLTVKSWNSWLGQEARYSGGPSTTNSLPDAITMADTSGMQIAIIKPNLTDQSAQNMALRYIDTLMKQILNVNVVMPGELDLSPYDILSINGGGTDFDTDYVVKSIRRHFSATAGFSEYIRGYASGTTSGIPEGSAAT